MRASERMKKVLTILLAVCMVMQFVPTTAFAEEGTSCVEHSFDAATGMCSACDTQAVASTTIDGETEYYLTLDEAITAVKNCTADDKAGVKLYSNIDLGSTSYQMISGGEFTLDLNGHKIEGAHTGSGTLRISNGNVTITDSSDDGTGTITGYYGVRVDNGTVNINGGTISTGGKSGNRAVWVRNGTVTISGGIITAGTITGDGVNVFGGTVTINGGTITGPYGMQVTGGTVNINGGTVGDTGPYGMRVTGGTVNINGGSISGKTADLRYEPGTITLGLAEGATEGATFPDGLSAVADTGSTITLNEFLADGMAYWQGGKMLTVADDATAITGGDVTVKAVCPHSGNTNTVTDNENGTHSFTCSVCQNGVTGDHKWDAGTCAVCGAECAHSDATKLTYTPQRGRQDPHGDLCLRQGCECRREPHLRLCHRHVQRM